MTNQDELNVPPTFHLFKDRDGLPIVSVNSDGSVVVNPDVSLDEAATAFWNVVRSVWDQHAMPPSEIAVCRATPDICSFQRHC
jgi:hypothetical protein